MTNSSVSFLLSVSIYSTNNAAWSKKNVLFSCKFKLSHIVLPEKNFFYANEKFEFWRFLKELFTKISYIYRCAQHVLIRSVWEGRGLLIWCAYLHTVGQHVILFRIHGHVYRFKSTVTLFLSPVHMRWFTYGM